MWRSLSLHIVAEHSVQHPHSQCNILIFLHPMQFFQPIFIYSVVFPSRWLCEHLFLYVWMYQICVWSNITSFSFWHVFLKSWTLIKRCNETKIFPKKEQRISHCTTFFWHRNPLLNLFISDFSKCIFNVVRTQALSLEENWMPLALPHECNWNPFDIWMICVCVCVLRCISGRGKTANELYSVRNAKAII